MKKNHNWNWKGFSWLGFLGLLFSFTTFGAFFETAKSIDAAVEWGNGKAYFFKGGQYSRYDVKADRVDPGYPKSIKEWIGLPWTDGIDAALNAGNGKVYFLKGTQYVRWDIQTDRIDPGYPKPINNETWPGLPWTNGIDAAVYWKDGKVLVFEGNQYVRIDVQADHVDPGYPKLINSETWPGLPWSEGIDAALNGGNGKIYLFKDTQYVRWDIQTDRIDPGYPKPINNETWPGIMDLLR